MRIYALSWVIVSLLAGCAASFEGDPERSDCAAPCDAPGATHCVRGRFIPTSGGFPPVFEPPADEVRFRFAVVQTQACDDTTGRWRADVVEACVEPLHGESTMRTGLGWTPDTLEVAASHNFVGTSLTATVEGPGGTLVSEVAGFLPFRTESPCRDLAPAQARQFDESQSTLLLESPEAPRPQVESGAGQLWITPME